MLKATAGKIHADDHHGLAAAAELVYGKPGHARRSWTRWCMSRFREQYVDALSVYLQEQEVAGLDIVTDGDCRFDARHRRPELDAAIRRITWAGSTRCTRSWRR